MKELKGRVAAVTGAASGIGRALALNLAAEGCHLAIADVNVAGLNETAEKAGSSGVRITTHIVDVAKREQVKRYADETVKAHGAVHLVINNAGVTILGPLEDISYEEFEWLMGVNLWGVIYGCKEFLPYLRQQDAAHIVNVSSVNSIFTNPGNGPYCTAKFAVRGFTETLVQELSGTRVKVSCVHPGGIKTDIVTNARFLESSNAFLTREEGVAIFNRAMAKTTADKAARIIIAGIKKDRQRIMVGPDAYVLDWLKRLFPVGLQKLAGSRMILERMKKKAGLTSS